MADLPLPPTNVVERLSAIWEAEIMNRYVPLGILQDAAKDPDARSWFCDVLIAAGVLEYGEVTRDGFSEWVYALNRKTEPSK